MIKKTAIASLLLGALALYKRGVSPLFHAAGARCRHLPTCSDYASDAIRRHGALKGSILAFSRVSRCHPFGSSGFDPVPESVPDDGWRLWRYGDWAWTKREAKPCP